MCGHNVGDIISSFLPKTKLESGLVGLVGCVVGLLEMGLERNGCLQRGNNQGSSLVDETMGTSRK